MKFNPSLLIQARQAQGLTQAALAEAVGLSQSKVSKIQTGSLAPSEEDVAALARALRVTPEFFNWEDDVHGLGTASYYHRKQKSLKVSQLERIQAEVNMLAMRMRRLLLNLDVAPALQLPDLDPDVVGSSSEAARHLRELWRVPMGPVADMIRYAESAGILVARRDFGTHRIDAISAWFPGCFPLMVLNEGLAPERERFVIAHEIAHLTMHENRPPRNDAEKDADAFAEEFLMPAREVSPQLRGLNVEKAVALKSYWKVQTQAVVLRAQALGAVTPARARSLFAYMNKLGILKHEPAPIEREEPNFLPSLPRLHVKELGYSVLELADLLAMVPEDVACVVDSVPTLRVVQ